MCDVKIRSLLLLCIPAQLLLVLATVLAIEPAAFAQADPDREAARELLAKARAASGCSSLKPEAVLHEEWQFLTLTGPGVTDFWVSLTDGARIVRVEKNLVALEGVRGTEYAELARDRRPAVRPLSEVPRVSGLLHRMRFHHLHPEKHGGSATLAAPWTRKGTDCPGVRYEFPDCPPFTMYFDPKTFMPVRLEADEGGEAPVTVEYVEPKTLLGITRPIRLLGFGPDGKQTSESLLVDFDVLPGPDPGLFRELDGLSTFQPQGVFPGGQMTWAGLPPQAFAPDAPAELVQRRQLLEAFHRSGPMTPFVVDGSLNGRHLRLLVDTGANGTIIRKDYVDSLGLPAAPSALIEAPVGARELARCKAGALSFPYFAWYWFDLWIDEDSGLFGDTAVDIHGALGMDLFYGLTLISEPDQHAFTVMRLEQPYPPLDVSVLPLDLSEGLPVTKVTIDDGKSLQVVVDTGCGAPLLVSSASLEKLGYRVDFDRLPPRETRTFGATLQGAGARVGRLKLGRLEIKDPIIEVSKSPLYGSSAGGFDVDGLLGADILARLRFVIDPVGKVLHLAPASSWTDHVPMTAGIILRKRRDEFVVDFVGRHSPAERAGVRAGDRIVSVAGTPLEGQSGEDIARLLKVEEGKTWSITIERGEETIDVEVPIEAWPPRLQRSRAQRGS
ncbi:MAG: aspartyl protease family protein [Planctomycetota bacterium]